jgi:hypothetical protein
VVKFTPRQRYCQGRTPEPTKYGVGGPKNPAGRFEGHKCHVRAEVRIPARPAPSLVTVPTVLSRLQIEFEV